jgi:hypothetical protein
MKKIEKRKSSKITTKHHGKHKLDPKKELKLKGEAYAKE